MFIQKSIAFLQLYTPPYHQDINNLDAQRLTDENILTWDLLFRSVSSLHGIKVMIFYECSKFMLYYF